MDMHLHLISLWRQPDLRREHDNSSVSYTDIKLDVGLVVAEGHLHHKL